MDAKGEIMLTIMASLAQQESQSLSQNVKPGIQYRYKQGEVQVNHNRFLGYTKDEHNKLVINPEQAKIVKRNYREYADIDEKLEEIQMELLRLANSKEDYDDGAEEIYLLRELKQEVMMKNAAREGLRQRTCEMTKYLKGQPQQLETYDDLLVRQLIEIVTIHKRNLTIEFKSGI